MEKNHYHHDNIPTPPRKQIPKEHKTLTSTFFWSLEFPCPSKPYCTSLKLLPRMAGCFFFVAMHAVSCLHQGKKKKQTKKDQTKTNKEAIEENNTFHALNRRCLNHMWTTAGLSH